MASEPLTRLRAASRLELERCLTLLVHIGAGQLLGRLPGSTGVRINYPILGGCFAVFEKDHPIAEGEVLPGGEDRFLEYADGGGRLDARYCLRTTEGALINVRNRGWLNVTTAGRQRMDEGCWPLPETEYHCQGTPEFEVDDGPLHWLAREVFIAQCRYPAPNEVRVDVYRLPSR